jgi:hypothetical protein
MTSVANNLSNRIRTTANKISGSKLASNRPVRQTLSRRQTTSARASTTVANKLGIPSNDFDDPEAGLTDPFENPVLLAFILLITFGFIAYGLYRYYTKESEYNPGQTYYGTDILAYQPLFTLNTDKIEKCVDRCQKDSLCSGLTFNSETLTCLGTEDGQLREDANNFTSWVKPKSQLGRISGQTKKTGIDKPVVGLADSQMTIKNTEFARPPFISRFNFGLFLYLNDFYEGHGSWRNIICKGTEWPAGDPFNTPYWETVAAERPDQCLGIWLAPFNNNLRICLTTRRQISGPSATTPSASTNQSTQTPTIQQTLEFIDIQNVPTRKLFHISVNMVEGGMEVYLNGKLNRMIALKGAPVWNELPLTILPPVSTPATIMDLVFIPESANLDDIREQTRKLEEYSEKLKK